MSTAPAKPEVFNRLQKEILALQGISRPAADEPVGAGLAFMGRSFPNGAFPLAAVHELISYAPECAAATNGFLAGLLATLLKTDGLCLWVSTSRRIFPPALPLFGIAPERIIFIDAAGEKEALWTIGEALKCDALAAVVGELKEVGFTESRRLQLAVEQSRVTGFIHRLNPRTENTTAFVSRWKIAPLASLSDDGLPGVGLASWNVQLQKVRNGRPGAWQVAWSDGGFKRMPLLRPSISPAQKSIVKTG